MPTAEINTHELEISYRKILYAQALVKFQRNQTHAAAFLGIPLRTFTSRLGKYGLQTSQTTSMQALEAIASSVPCTLRTLGM